MKIEHELFIATEIEAPKKLAEYVLYNIRTMINTNTRIKKGEKLEIIIHTIITVIYMSYANFNMYNHECAI